MTFRGSKALKDATALESLEASLCYQHNYADYVREAADFLQKRIGRKPEFGIVLGSGLGDLVRVLEGAEQIPYAQIPHFPVPTVAGHEGNLIIGKLGGVPAIGLQGRKHYYEVADQPMNTGLLQVVFPVHVLANLGIQNYFATNAAGGLNLKYNVGDVMVIRSHLNLLPNPLLGKEHNLPRLDGEQAWRFQPLNSAYDPYLRRLLLEAGSKHKKHVHEGVYAAVTGPTYETEAEVIALRDGLKVDAVGMSTAPEVIVARNRGMNVVGMSCITNKVRRDGTNATNHQEVMGILNAKKTRERLATIVTEFFRLYKEG